MIMRLGGSHARYQRLQAHALAPAQPLCGFVGAIMAGAEA